MEIGTSARKSTDISDNKSEQANKSGKNRGSKQSVTKEPWVLNIKDVVRGSEIGRSSVCQECVVYKGVLKSHNNMPIAIKRQHPECRKIFYVDVKEQSKEILKKVPVLQHYKHENLIQIIGIATYAPDQMSVIFEFVPNGRLDSYLLKHTSKVTLNDRIKFSSDIASGMEYLEKKGCVHKNLRARKCLLGNNNVVKISDFGITWLIFTDCLIGGGPIPFANIKWNAPESLEYGLWSSKSDVWEFGVVMWQIFANSNDPYPGKNNFETVEFLQGGHRMKPPPKMPEWLAKLMQECWQWNAEDRPSFADLKKSISDNVKTLK